MSDAEQAVCRNIHHFILFDLTNKLDDSAFTQTTLDALGRYLFDLINRNIPGSTDALIKAVIKKIERVDIDLENYYLTLCQSVLKFVETPRRVYIQFLRQYVAVFMHDYPSIKAAAHSKIDTINASLDANRETIGFTIKASNSDIHIAKDIREDEKRLEGLYRQCNELRTQKEMLQYSVEYLDEFMAKFCTPTDRESVLKELKDKSIKAATGSSITADIEFVPYKEALKTSRANINDITRIFFVVKLYSFYDDITRRGYAVEYLPDDVKEQTYKTLRAESDSLPRITTLKQAKATDATEYHSLLDELSRKYDLLSQITEKINNSVSIDGRKSILLKAIELFRSGEYDLFNNIVPIQLEGLFGDYLKDGTVFSRFTNLNLYPHAVLKEKIAYIKNLGQDLYPEAVMYFGSYFNNMIRNRIAHGDYTYSNNESAAIFATELLFDLNFLLHMLLRKSETERMYRIIHRYKGYRSEYLNKPNFHFGCLFNDLTRNRTHYDYDYDSIELLRPMQFAYWLINPYYEEIYGRVGDVSTLKKLRADFLSNDFWLYVLDKLNEVINTGWDYLSIDREFSSIVKGLFSCDLPDNTRPTLAKVNAALSLIDRLR